MEKQKEIFTIGHSTHRIEYFLELLESQSINCLIDVRSTPASSYNPQFNKEPLKNFLKKHNIIYMHFGEEFGARHEKFEFLDNDGIVNFKRFQKTRQFQNGIERVDIGLSKGYRISLMCSEGNPLECHRFSMISEYLEGIDIKVNHILKNKTVVSNEELEKKLMQKFKNKLPQQSLFDSSITIENQLEIAYQLHNKEIGWQSKKFNHQNQT